jgi:hypothetical protein
VIVSLASESVTGRNERCPCGSGKKFKKCCIDKPKLRMNPAGPPPEVVLKAALQIRQKQKEQQEWIARYGHIRPIISIDNWGKKFVAVANRLEYSENWKFIPDFLLDYVPHVFGKEWWDAEVAKPQAERHPLFQWRVGCLRHKQAGQIAADGKWEVAPDGMTGAYMSFAFNLFAIENNSRLDELLLTRLKHPDQFQGALHEVFVEATCLRAGFAIEREDERDPATRHAEFTATHKATGERFSVEAKSKHRAGVLGQAGIAQPDNKLSLAFGRLINDAAGKKPKYPLLIFLDTNLPFRATHHVYGEDPAVPSRYMRGLLKRIRDQHAGQYPYLMLVFTNIPHHYAAPHEADPPKHIHMMTTEPPGTNKRQALDALYEAVPLYGNIPNVFPTP